MTNGMKVCLMVGNPVDGMSIYGPYDTMDEAIAVAEEHMRDQTWQAVPMIPPSSRPEYIYVGRTQEDGIAYVVEESDEIMVTVWSDGDCEIAGRQGTNSWGPPILLDRRPTR